jgi:hypothetical protein
MGGVPGCYIVSGSGPRERIVSVGVECAGFLISFKVDRLARVTHKKQKG